MRRATLQRLLVLSERFALLPGGAAAATASRFYGCRDGEAGHDTRGLYDAGV